MNSSWLANASANRLNQSYVQEFVDLSGNAIIRNGSVNIKTGKLFLPQGDISMNGNIICSGSISLGTTTGAGYQMTVNGNTHVTNLILVDNNASFMSNLGVGKASNDTYPLDVSGASRFSSNITVGGAATLNSSMTVSSVAALFGNVGIGSEPSNTDMLFVDGQSRATGQALFDDSIAIGSGVQRDTDSALLVKAPISSTAASDVTFNVPTNLYTSTDITNSELTNKLQIDSKNRAIKPSIESNGTPITDGSVGWDLGATGGNSFNRIYGKTLEVSNNVGIGKSSDASYAVDVSGATRLSSSLIVGGATTLNTTLNVSGDSKFTGIVGVGKAADNTDIALDVSGNTIVSGNTHIARSLAVGSITPSTATLHVNAPNSTATNTVILDAPNVIYTAASSSNSAQTNFLEIDTKTQTILPYARSSNGTLLNTASTGWNLGEMGAYRFNNIYARDVAISTNTINIEDDSGNKIAMSFDATIGAINYTVKTITGEVFVIKGVQTQKITSGSGNIDPAMLELTGLSFGDSFEGDTYDLTSTFTYDLTSTTYTGDGTAFTSSAGAQTLASFVSGENLTTLLANIPTNKSVVIKVGATDGRSTNLEGIDVPGSLVSLANKIISVKKNGSPAIKWTLWNSENYINVAGNFLHYIELKNINMASGTYFVAKSASTLTYNSTDQQFLKTADLTASNGDLYLYIQRGPGRNWTKIPVSLPQTGSIQTQQFANSAIKTVKLADNSVTGNKIVDGSITGDKFTDNSITTDKIADGSITAAKLADGSISGSKLADGVISSATMIADGIITGSKLVAGSIGTSLLDASAVTMDKLAIGSVTADKLADSSVGTSEIIDGSITSVKLAPDSVSGSNVITGTITGDKIFKSSITGDSLLDGTITAIKFAPGTITGSLIDASSITMDKIATGAVATAKIANLAITTGKLAETSVTTDKIANGAVTSDKLAAASVNSSNIVDGAVTTSKIINFAVTAAKIADGAITTDKMDDSSVTDTKLNAESVTEDKIAGNSIITSKIADFAVTRAKISDSAVTTVKIADGSVTGTKIATGAVLEANIGDLGISTNNIANGAITTAKITATISSSLLDVSAVDTNNIAANAVTTAKIAGNAITSAKIADATITTAKLSSSSVTTSVIADGSITYAKLEPGFSFPSSAGLGTAVDATSNLRINSIATGKKPILSSYVGYQSQLINGNSSFPVSVTTTADTGKVSGDGSVFISAVSSTRVDVYRLNTTGQYVFSRSITTSNVDGLEISNDGNTFISYLYNGVGFFNARHFVIHECKKCEFTGSISGTTLTVTSITSGALFFGMTLYGASIAAGRTIATFVTGTGGIGTYTISGGSQTVDSTTMTGDIWFVSPKRFVPPNAGTTTLRAGSTFKAVRMLISPDGTKLLLYYWVNSSVYHSIYIVNVSDLSLLAIIDTTTITSFNPYINDTGLNARVAWSSDGSRIIFSSPLDNSNRGRTLVYKINYTQIARPIPFALTSTAPSPSYGLAGYTPILLENLPARFRLKVTSTGRYPSAGTSGSTGYTGAGFGSYVVADTTSSTSIVIEFSADRPNNLYSTTGVNTYRLFNKNYDRGESFTYYLWTSSTASTGTWIRSDIGDFTLINLTWQIFLKDGTTDQVIIWTPFPGAGGTYVVTTSHRIHIGAGAPELFTLEPIDDFSASNTVTKIGDFAGTMTTGADSYLGKQVDMSSDGNTIVMSAGTLNDATGSVKIYNYIADNDWTLRQTLLGTSALATNTGFGRDLKLSADGTVLSVSAHTDGSSAATAFIAGYELLTGVYTFINNFYGSLKLCANTTFATKLSMTDSGRIMGIEVTGSGTAFGNAYFYELSNSDVLSKAISCDILVLNSKGFLYNVGDSDATTGFGYSLRLTGGLLNNGTVAIYNSASPTLSFRGTTQTIEFRTTSLTNAWGAANEWRWAADTTGLRIQKSGIANNIAWFTGNTFFMQGRLSSIGSTPLIFSPTNAGPTNGGAFTITNQGIGSAISGDISMLGTPGIRILVNRDSSTGTLWSNVIQSDRDFEIQTGQSLASHLGAVLNSSNYLTGRRLHISAVGDVGIGTNAVTGTKLTVEGDTSASGTIKTNNYGHVLKYDTILNRTVTDAGPAFSNLAVALGFGTNSIATSSDGITWTARGTSIFTTLGRGAAWNGSLWVAVGQGTNSIATSLDGITWNGLGTSIFTSYGQGIAWNGSLWVAVGNGTNSIATSPDGITWTGRGTSIFTGYGNGIAWSPSLSLWVATGKGTNSIATSPDGITWTGRGTSIFTTEGWGVVWSSSLSLWVAVGMGTNTIATSPDGITWTGRGATIISFTGLGIAWNGNLFVAVGQGTNSIATSPDGITWTGRTNPLSSAGHGVAWTGSLWIAIGSGTNTIATSPDGITWTGRTGTSTFANGGYGVGWGANIPRSRPTGFNSELGMGSAYSGRVAMSSDGTVMVSSSVLTKSIYVYRLTNGSWPSNPTSTITRTPATFGRYFALSKNGQKIAASDGDTIWMYIWNSETSTWDLQTQTITNGTGIAYGTGGFVKNLKLTADGGRLAIISYSTAAISKVYIYNTITGALLVTLNPFGDSALDMSRTQWGSDSTSFAVFEWYRFRLEFSSTDGTSLMVSSAPSAYGDQILIYDINYTTSTATFRKNTPVSESPDVPGTTNFSNIGRKLAISADGNTYAFASYRIDLFSGTRTDGPRVTIYKRAPGSGIAGWTLSRIYYDFNVPGATDRGFGTDICLDDTGNAIFMSTIADNLSITQTPGTPGIVSRGLFMNGAWGNLINVTGLAGAYFGYGLATNSDGTTLAVSETKGSSTDEHGGRVHIYNYPISPLNLSSNGALSINPTFTSNRISTATNRTFIHDGGTESQTTYTFKVAGGTPQNAICDILLVGGGGGGGSFGGGGGAGAVLLITDYALSAGSYTISVGRGGTGGVNFGSNGTNGGDTSIVIDGVTYTAIGGGGGGTRDQAAGGAGRAGSNGGSGGGGSHGEAGNLLLNVGGTSTKNTYPGWTSYGNEGGEGKDGTATGYGSGGGGGAGGVGAIAGGNIGGNGGAGIDLSSIFGTEVGHSGWFAGGGGGASHVTGTVGLGNGGNGLLGGGGNGPLTYTANGNPGLANTGGGGGGSGYTYIGGNGGSGVVIIKLKQYNEPILNGGMVIAASGEVGIGATPVTGTRLTVSGDVTVTGEVTSSSDDRLKDNESLITNAIDTIMKLRPEIYDKKPDFASTDPSTFYKESGLVAQDIWYGAPELRHLVKLGNRTEFVCEYKPITYPPLVPGFDISGVEYQSIEVPIDVSTDASGNSVDASGNPLPTTRTEIVTIDNRPQSYCATKAIYPPINPADIAEIPLASDIHEDPDYTSLGWGDTPSSVNYIGLIPYLIKSIQELKAEINRKRAEIEQRKQTNPQ